MGQDASLLHAVGDGETARQRPIVLHLTLLAFMELAEDGEKFFGTAKARQDFPQSIMDYIRAENKLASTYFLFRLQVTTFFFSFSLLQLSVRTFR